MTTKCTALQIVEALQLIRGKLMHTDTAGIELCNDVIESAVDLGCLVRCDCGAYLERGYAHMCENCAEDKGAFDVVEARNEVFRDNVRGDCK